MSITDQVDRLDVGLFEHVQRGGTSFDDLTSLLALHAAMAARGRFDYLEIGSYLGASLQSFVADSRCRSVISIDRRDEVSPDERAQDPAYPLNTTSEMLSRLAEVPGADLGKVTALDGSTDELDLAGLHADLAFIDAEHTNEAAFRDARFCRTAVGEQGVIVFHDRGIVSGGIRRFLSELGSYRAYPLSHVLLVVEIGIPTLLSDPRVRGRVPRKLWLAASRLGLIKPALLVGELNAMRR